MDNVTKTISIQLRYLVADKYEIGIYDRFKDVMQRRVMSYKGIFKSISFFKYANFQGQDIFISPFGPSPYVFVDDINVSDISRMEKDGLPFAVVVESSPLNYQGWLKVSESTLNEETRTNVGRYLARKYGGDMRSSDWRHFGRLAGFTNRKPAYVDESGRYPFVNIYDYNENVISNNELIVAESMEAAEKERQAIASKTSYHKITSQIDTNSPPEIIYQAEINALRDYWNGVPGHGFNPSDGDWNAVLTLIRCGFDSDSISDVLYSHSESVSKRSPSRAKDYVFRTVENAFRVANQSR